MYYYLPLGTNIFGMNNYANEKLNTYVYDEGESKKRGGNVCSLIYKDLAEEGIIKEWEDSGNISRKRLTLVFGNYSGQNKHNMIIRLGLRLLDMGIYEEVEVLFLKTDHTKNIFDRRFKDLKRSVIIWIFSWE